MLDNVMPDSTLFRLILEGGFAAAILYAFYLLLTNALRGMKNHEAVISSLQQRYIEDLKAMQAKHDEQFCKERDTHRREMREIAENFSHSLQSVGDNLAKLTGELQLVSLRLDNISIDAKENARNTREFQEHFGKVHNAHD